MPNHVPQVIHFTQKEDLDGNCNDILKKISSKDQAIDFNKIIPPPKNMIRGNLSTIEMAELDKKGVPYWYKWQRDNWGTKWNAYEIEILDESDYELKIKFQTAWNVPRQIIMKLIEIFPEFKIDHVGVDEGRFFAEYISSDEEGVDICEYNSESVKKSLVIDALHLALF